MFALLANVNKSCRVLDICAGTGGFLISAMHQMMKTVATKADRTRIQKDGLIGVEQQPHMFALAASNMILRGDGKANLYQGSCFDEKITASIKAHKCTIGMLNPPFSQTDPEQHELHYIKHMLDCLKKSGTGIALAPVSCAISPHPARHEILKYHTLDAVMSLPIELFSPVGTVACAMVFTAHIPHKESNRKTWLGYWRDDGFVKTKHKGRIDQNQRWQSIRDHWVEAFRNRHVDGRDSLMRHLTADDEWLAEAYLETDYSTLTSEDFAKELKQYVVFRILSDRKNHG